MKEELCKQLGDAECKKLAEKHWAYWNVIGQIKGRRSAQIGGMVAEAMAKDFIRGFLSPEFDLKSGLIFDKDTKKISPQIDAILYKGVSLWEYKDVAVVGKEQVKAIFEIKSWIDTPAIFGELRKKGSRDRKPDTGLARALNTRREFLPKDAKCILFTFEIYSAESDDKIIERLSQICDDYAVVVRDAVARDKRPQIFNFDSSVSRLLQWLRNLS